MSAARRSAGAGHVAMERGEGGQRPRASAARRAGGTIVQEVEHFLRLRGATVALLAVAAALLTANLRAQMPEPAPAPPAAPAAPAAAPAAVPAAAPTAGETPAEAAALDAGHSLTDLRPEDVLEAAKHGAGAGEDTPLPDPAAIVAALDRGRDFLIGSQNADGSWGSWDQPSDEFWSNPYSHKAWIIATTGLVAMSLLEQHDHAPSQAAADRGLQYLLAQGPPQRPSDWDVDNTWGDIYGLDAVTTALGNPRWKDGERGAALRAKAVEYIGQLQQYESPTGGWGYYDFDTKADRPSWATSFETAAGVVGLVQARELGIELPPNVLEAAVKGLEKAHMKNGAYSYSLDPIPHYNLEYINNVKGSLSRIQAGNYALVRAGTKDVSHADLLAGLDLFFEHHRFLDVARQKPVPHEAYYFNSGYFYFFGHFYAARLLDLLTPAERARYSARLAREVVKTQEPDGSMWDYYMNTYGKAYGTAYGVMTLQRTLPER